MELTPEERQRIYEGEKARIEAQDRIKAEKRGKGRALRRDFNCPRTT